MSDPLNDILRHFSDLQYGHLEHRTCTEASPMPAADRDIYRWHHPDANELGPFFNLVLCECPHCNFIFASFPKEQS